MKQGDLPTFSCDQVFQRDAGIIRGSVGRRLELPRPKEWQSDRGPKPDFVRF